MAGRIPNITLGGDIVSGIIIATTDCVRGGSGRRGTGSGRRGTGSGSPTRGRSGGGIISIIDGAIIAFVYQSARCLSCGRQCLQAGIEAASGCRVIRRAGRGMLNGGLKPGTNRAVKWEEGGGGKLQVGWDPGSDG